MHHYLKLIVLVVICATCFIKRDFIFLVPVLIEVNNCDGNFIVYVYTVLAPGFKFIQHIHSLILDTKHLDNDEVELG